LQPIRSQIISIHFGGTTLKTFSTGACPPISGGSKKTETYKLMSLMLFFDEKEKIINENCKVLVKLNEKRNA
jgi:hypothetical protein